jgi:hypothetical protein
MVIPEHDASRGLLGATPVVGCVILRRLANRSRDQMMDGRIANAEDLC